MNCADVGVLRAYIDDELPPARRMAVVEHLDGCAKCRLELARLSRTALGVGNALARLGLGAEEAVSPRLALREWRRRVATRSSTWRNLIGGLQRMSNGSLARRWRVALATMATLLVATALVFNPVGAAVGDLLSVFRAEKFAPVSIDPASLQAGGVTSIDPKDVGDLQVRAEPEHRRVASVAEARGMVDFPVRQIKALPAGYDAQPEVFVNTPADVVFVFDLAKTRAALAANGIHVDLPAELDGAAVRAFVPAGVQQAYAPAAGTGPGLMLLQTHSPTLEMPAVLDTPQMRDLFFSLSGMPPELVDQLRAITSSGSTVPVPVVKGDTSREVTVDGTQGLLVTHRPSAAGADAPEGSYVVWQKGGIVYALGGAAAEAELLAAANSLAE